MRTTVTLDPDVQNLLADAVYRQDKTSTAVLNDAVRKGVAPSTAPTQKRTPPQWLVLDMGEPLVDLTKACALANELDDGANQAKLGRGA